MGPSGCGKSTLIRCLNRIHELTPRAKVQGEVILDGVNIYSSKLILSPSEEKSAWFSRSLIRFPTMSIYDNAVAGLKLNGVRDKKKLDALAEKSLRMAFLWDEVKNDLEEGWNQPVRWAAAEAMHRAHSCSGA